MVRIRLALFSSIPQTAKTLDFFAGALSGNRCSSHHWDPANKTAAGAVQAILDEGPDGDSCWSKTPLVELAEYVFGSSFKLSRLNDTSPAASRCSFSSAQSRLSNGGTAAISASGISGTPLQFWDAKSGEVLLIPWTRLIRFFLVHGMAKAWPLENFGQCSVPRYPAGWSRLTATTRLITPGGDRGFRTASSTDRCCQNRTFKVYDQVQPAGLIALILEGTIANFKNTELGLMQLSKQVVHTETSKRHLDLRSLSRPCRAGRDARRPVLPPWKSSFYSSL
jgi:hypothetical protein